jgi:hypothetical protein
MTRVVVVTMIVVAVVGWGHEGHAGETEIIADQRNVTMADLACAPQHSSTFQPG